MEGRGNCTKILQVHNHHNHQKCLIYFFFHYFLNLQSKKSKKKNIEFASLAPLEIKTYVGQKSFVGLVSYFKWTVFHGCEPTRHYCETTSVFVFEPRYSTRQEHSSPDMAMFSICGGQCVQTDVPQPNIKIKS